jgi:predicted P-loop ATPase
VVTGQDRAWATRGNVEPSDKDSLLRAHRVWVQVLDEVDEFTSKYEWPAQKRWMTEPADIFRAPYGRRPALHRRRFVFGATTNKTEFIPGDSAAARRFLTISCGEIDLELLAQRSDQLWAEARDLFLEATQQGSKRPPRSAYVWWLKPDEADAVLELASDHQPAPIHRETIELWLAKRFLPDPPRTEEILDEALVLKRTDYSKFQHAVGDAMRSLGYVSKNVTFADGRRGKGWVKP